MESHGHRRGERVTTINESILPACLLVEGDARMRLLRESGLLEDDGLGADIAAEGGSPLSHSFCRYAVATGERLIIADARTSPLLNQSPAISELDVVADAGVPLQLRAANAAPCPTWCGVRWRAVVEADAA